MLYFLPSTLELCCLQYDWHPKLKGLGVLTKTDPEHEGVSEPCCFPQENSTRTDVVHRSERVPKKTFHVVLQTPLLGNSRTEIEDALRGSRSLEVTLGHLRPQKSYVQSSGSVKDSHIFICKLNCKSPKPMQNILASVYLQSQQQGSQDKWVPGTYWPDSLANL